MYDMAANLYVCVNKLNVTLRLHLIINYQKRHCSALSRHCTSQGFTQSPPIYCLPVNRVRVNIFCGTILGFTSAIAWENLRGNFSKSYCSTATILSTSINVFALFSRIFVKKHVEGAFY